MQHPGGDLPKCQGRRGGEGAPRWSQAHQVQGEGWGGARDRGGGLQKGVSLMAAEGTPEQSVSHLGAQVEDIAAQRHSVRGSADRQDTGLGSTGLGPREVATQKEPGNRCGEQV